MDRRLGGLVLLILVVLASITVPNLNGRRVPGSPVAAYVPPPPQAGDCASSVSQPPPINPDTPDDFRIDYPTAVYGSCSAPVIGEVMSVDQSAHPLATATESSYQSASAACELDEVNYVGSIGPFDPAKLTQPSIAWQASVTVESISVGPSPLQRAGGQSWTACLGVTPDRKPYRGRIRGALTNGVLPPIYGSCWKSLPASTEQQTDDQLVSCAIAHPIEILATTQIIDATATPAQVSRSCELMASRAMRTADPTRGGLVVIDAYSMDGSSVLPLTQEALLAGYVGCIASVRAPRRLTDTLIGLGDRPLPVTG